MQTYLFDPIYEESTYWQAFLQTDLGQLYQAIPFETLAALFPVKRNPQGKKPWLDVKGMIGLEILKFYTGLSDAKLVERLNTDWAMRLFCGLCPIPRQWIKDKDIPSHYRIKLASEIDYQAFQRELAQYWKPYIENPQMVLTDATCYESYIKYPTDVKLLWDSCTWVHQQMKILCRHRIAERMQIPRPRNRFNEQKKKQLTFQKQRRKTKKQERKRRKALLYMLNKLLGQLSDLLLLYQLQKQHPQPDEQFYQRLAVIEKIYEQQQFHYHNPPEPIADRIVSLYKPYLRPIVRGKETKRVEFGMKVNVRQVDGLNFIEHMSFKAFNEAKHLKRVVYQHHRDFGVCKQVGADKIYATNENRRFCTANRIASCFKPKGRTGKDEQQARILRSVIGKGRATVLEGSFGNEKNHYNLERIKARNDLTEPFWIFMGMMTANAVQVAHRMQQSKAPPHKQAA